MNRYFLRGALIGTLAAASYFAVSTRCSASDAGEAGPFVKTDWGLNLRGHYVSLSVQNNSNQPIRVSPEPSFFSTTEEGELDLKYVYGPWTSKPGDSIIYPAIMFVVKSGDKNQLSNLSDGGGRSPEAIEVDPGKKQVIKYSWNGGFNDIATDSKKLFFRLIQNGEIISQVRTQREEGDILKITDSSTGR